MNAHQHNPVHSDSGPMKERGFWPQSLSLSFLVRQWQFLTFDLCEDAPKCWHSHSLIYSSTIHRIHVPLRHETEGAGRQVSGVPPSSSVKAEALKSFTRLSSGVLISLVPERLCTETTVSVDVGDSSSKQIVVTGRIPQVEFHRYVFFCAVQAQTQSTHSCCPLSAPAAVSLSQMCPFCYFCPADLPATALQTYTHTQLLSCDTTDEPAVLFPSYHTSDSADAFWRGGCNHLRACSPSPWKLGRVGGVGRRAKG